ncbi:MAG TPA: glycosyltransferase, partial [Candidatus Woesebacteria bacterium]|nr:glycosyltransferase [Candidatus Woesebacteria bacterium]
RIQKFYRRDSIIINPPIDINQDTPVLSKKGDGGRFFLTGGRLARAKRYDLAVKACTKLNLPLKVFGRDFANYLFELKSLAGPTVEFLGEVTQAEKQQLFSQAQAYLFCSDNEDFGMVSVEAQGHGCPVVGYNSGGIKETVIDGKTGVLFNELTVDSLSQAISRFQKLNLKSSDCHANASRFSTPIFIQKFKDLVYSKNYSSSHQE